MFFDQNNEQKLDELVLENERLSALTKDLLEVNSDLLTKYLSDASHFTKENWEEIQEIRKKLDQDLQTKLDNITDPRKAEKARVALNPPAHWLFVR